MVQEEIKTIIIDDEFPARKLLSEYASKIANIKLCGVCDNAVHALELMQNEAVDLIFTDIQMPDLSGMEFIRSLKNPPLIVFTTAHSEYAIDSYELDAVDYLLKPISFPRFVQAVNKVQERIQLLRSKESETKTEKDYFMVKADYKLYRIDFVNIAGSIANAGIPNNILLIIGDKTAVIKPTLIPNLYDAINVKK